MSKNKEVNSTELWGFLQQGLDVARGGGEMAKILQEHGFGTYFYVLSDGLIITSHKPRLTVIELQLQARALRGGIKLEAPEWSTQNYAYPFLREKSLNPPPSDPDGILNKTPYTLNNLQTYLKLHDRLKKTSGARVPFTWEQYQARFILAWSRNNALVPSPFNQSAIG